MNLRQEAWPTYFTILGKCERPPITVEESELLCQRIENAKEPAEPDEEAID